MLLPDRIGVYHPKMDIKDEARLRDEAQSSPRTRGRTRWRLFALVMAPSLAASTALFVAVAQGVLAVSFLVSNQNSKVSAKHVEGTGLIEYTAVDRRYDGSLVPVMVAGLRHSKSEGVCQSTVFRNIPLVGTITMKATTKQVTADDAYTDGVKASVGSSTLKNVNNGIAAGASTKGPGIAEGDKANPGNFAEEADSISVTDSKEIVVAASARISRSIGATLKYYRGVHECF